MMKKMKLTALALAMLAALSMNVYANEAEQPAETAAEESAVPAEIAFPGMLELNVTSSMSDPDAPTFPLFDRLADTGLDVTVSEENRTFTVYASVGVRDFADRLAVQMAGEPYTTVEVTVYASNDDETWVQLDVTAPTEESGFYVFDILGCEERYTFWRIDFTVGMGDGFSLSEIALFKQDKGEPEYIYDLGDSLEEGEIPELIPAESAEEPAEIPAKPFPYARIPLLMGFGMGK